MNRWIFALLLVIPLPACAQTKPARACPFVGFQGDPNKEPDLAEVSTKTPALTWMACDSPKGCVPLKVDPGSPVVVYERQGEWTCG